MTNKTAGAVLLAVSGVLLVATWTAGDRMGFVAAVCSLTVLYALSERA